LVMKCSACCSTIFYVAIKAHVPTILAIFLQNVDVPII
jgi:hypothetical protein